MSLSATGPVRDWAADCYEEEAKVDNGGVIWGGVIGVKLCGVGAKISAVESNVKHLWQL